MNSQNILDYDAKTEVIYRLNLGQSIDYELANRAFQEILALEDITSRNYFMITVLHALMVSKPSAEAITGMLDAAFSLDSYDPRKRPTLKMDKPTITYVGSGKKGFKTVNISSLSAFVASCGDVAIAKYCSPSTSSMTGSQDFIEAVGANLNHSVESMVEIMRQVGIGFFRLEDVLPKFASAYSGIFMAPHALSFALAGMTGSFQTDGLIYGLAHPNTGLSLEVFKHYGVKSATVVGSSPDNVHFIDEISDAGVAKIHSYNTVTDNQPAQIFENLAEYTQNYDLEVTLDAISQGTDQKANVIKGLEGLSGNNIILAKQLALNAALITCAASGSQDIEQAYSDNLSIIKSGEPIFKLRQFVELTGGDTTILDNLLQGVAAKV